jgi:Family of unknown function (DUF5678)
MADDWTDIFNRYHGMWLALADDEKNVIAAARTAKQALSEATAKGFLNPLLYRVPDTLEAFAGYEIRI